MTRKSTPPSSSSPLHVKPTTCSIAAIAALLFTSAAAGVIDVERSASARRSLLGFTEKRGNATFQYSPLGPCLRCQYPEKNDEKYHCSETGYRIRLKCEEIQNNSTDESKIPQRKLSSLQDEDKDHFHASRASLGKSLSTLGCFKWRRLLDDASSTSEAGGQSYITYRSCLPGETEEKLSVFGFELIMVCLLLVSAPIAYFRQRHSAALPGIGLVRIPSSSSRL